MTTSCNRLPNTATAEERAAAHLAKIVWKREHRVIFGAMAARPRPRTRNSDPAYRKGIWPASKVAARSAA